MSESANATARMGNIWVPLGVALLGFAAQVLWFSAQFGGVTAKIDELERRVTLIEQVGSPALSSMRPMVDEMQRRMTGFEQGAIPPLQAMRAQIDINTRRTEALDHDVPVELARIGTALATQSQTITGIDREVQRLRDWRFSQTSENSSDAARDAVQDRSLLMLTENVAKLEEAFRAHTMRDAEDDATLSALRQAQSLLQDQVNRLRDFDERMASHAGEQSKETAAPR